MDGPLRHPDELKQFLRTLGPGRRPLPRQAHRQLDVLLGGQRGDEVEELEDDTDLLQAIPNELGIAKVDQVRSVHLDSPRGWPVDSAEQVQEGRLSTAGRTPHRDELSVGDRHVEPPKGDDLGLSRAIHLDDILRCPARHPYPPPSFPPRPTSIPPRRTPTTPPRLTHQPPHTPPARTASAH